MGPRRRSDLENSVINKTASTPDDWADDLAEGTLSRDQLNELARDYAADRQGPADRARTVAKLARDAELDHRAGQLKSAEARATVAIAITEAIQSGTARGGGGGFLSKLVGSGDRQSGFLNSAASQAHLALGGLARDRGDLALAEREYKAALESARLVQHSELAVGVSMLELGHTTQLQGRDKEAEEWLRQAHPIMVREQGAAYVPLDTYLLGMTLAGQQRWDEALATLKETEDAYAQKGVTKGVLDARLARTGILIRTGKLDDAERLATETYEMARRLGEAQYQGQARWHQSRIKRAEKKPEEAIALINEAIKFYEQAGDSWHHAQSCMVRAEIQATQGKLDDADRSLDEAARIAKAMKSPFLEGDCMRMRANLRFAEGRVPEARALLTDARKLFAEQGRQDRVAATDAQLEKMPPG